MPYETNVEASSVQSKAHSQLCPPPEVEHLDMTMQYHAVRLVHGRDDPDHRTQLAKAPTLAGCFRQNDSQTFPAKPVSQPIQVVAQDLATDAGGSHSKARSH